MAAGCQIPRLGNFLQLCGFIITNHCTLRNLSYFALTPMASLTAVSIFTTYHYFEWLSYSKRILEEFKTSGGYKDTMVTSRGRPEHL